MRPRHQGSARTDVHAHYEESDSTNEEIPVSRKPLEAGAAQVCCVAMKDG